MEEYFEALLEGLFICSEFATELEEVSWSIDDENPEKRNHVLFLKYFCGFCHCMTVVLILGHTGRKKVTY